MFFHQFTRAGLSILIPAGLIVFSGCGPPTGGSPVDLAEEEAALRAVSDQWQAFDDQQSAAGVAGLFGPEGTLAWEQGELISGPEAVESFMAKNYAFNPNNEGSWGPDHYDIAASGDLAVEHGGFESPGGIGGRYMTVYRKIAGGWKVVADMSLETTPNGGAPSWAADLLSEWYDAFNSRDAERLADIYTADARLRDALGREAIIARFEASWAESDEVCSGSFDGFEMVGSIGVGWGRDTCTVSPPGSGDTTTSLSNWLAVYEQQDDGSWLCIRDIGEPVGG
ncbi:MAG: DUF4440 domain-containing protein [Gemmatimonadetes bacterium]|nr:DUF4440 domain-containing protein [Gemmatimonadota bacterium]